MSAAAVSADVDVDVDVGSMLVMVCFGVVAVWLTFHFCWDSESVAQGVLNRLMQHMGSRPEEIPTQKPGRRTHRSRRR
jgi:hypothetical protein